MDYTSDSDVSDDTRDLVSQGLASARRKRTKIMLNLDRSPQRRLVSNTDITSVRHQMRAESLNDAASTRELDPLIKTVNTSQNHNTNIGQRYYKPR